MNPEISLLPEHHLQLFYAADTANQQILRDIDMIRMRGLSPEYKDVLLHSIYGNDVVARSARYLTVATALDLGLRSSVHNYITESVDRSDLVKGIILSLYELFENGLHSQIMTNSVLVNGRYYELPLNYRLTEHMELHNRVSRSLKGKTQRPLGLGLMDKYEYVIEGNPTYARMVNGIQEYMVRYYNHLSVPQMKQVLMNSAISNGGTFVELMSAGDSSTVDQVYLENMDTHNFVFKKQIFELDGARGILKICDPHILDSIQHARQTTRFNIEKLHEQGWLHSRNVPMMCPAGFRSGFDGQAKLILPILEFTLNALPAWAWGKVSSVY